MYLSHNGVTYKVERLSIGAMQAKVSAIGFNEAYSFIMVFNEAAEMEYMIRG